MADVSGKIVSCAGGANIDVQGFSRAPVNMRDSNPGTIRLCAGGVGRNIAENLAWLGAQVRMVSAVGKDPFGDIILKSCADAGILTEDIEILPDAHSSAYLVLTDSDGDMLAAVSDMHIMKNLGRDFILRHAEAFDAADAIVLDPNLSEESLDTLTSLWAHKPMFADPISTTYASVLKQFLPRLCMVKCNRQEAEIFSGMEIRNDADLECAADLILSQETKYAVITLGKSGVFYKDSTGLRLKKCHEPLEPVSATGAGDSFTAAMVYARLCDWPAEASLEFAMKAAEITLMDALTVSPRIASLTR